MCWLTREYFLFSLNGAPAAVLGGHVGVAAEDIQTIGSHLRARTVWLPT